MLSWVTRTNTYALVNVATRGYSKAYVERHGCWTWTTVKEIEEYIALIYFGLVKRSGLTDKYWRTIYHKLWIRKILSNFLHVVVPTNETPGNKLRKVEEFLASFKERGKLLYQPYHPKNCLRMNVWWSPSIGWVLGNTWKLSRDWNSGFWQTGIMGTL